MTPRGSGMPREAAQDRVGVPVRGAQREPDQVEVGRRHGLTAARLSSSLPVENISIV